MLCRRFILCAMLCTALVVPAVPAGAAEPYGPPIEVLNAPCGPDVVHADAVVGIEGRTRGFISYVGGDCSQRIRWFEGAEVSWTTAVTRYRAW